MDRERLRNDCNRQKQAAELIKALHLYVNGEFKNDEIE